MALLFLFGTRSEVGDAAPWTAARWCVTLAIALSHHNRESPSALARRCTITSSRSMGLSCWAWLRRIMQRLGFSAMHDVAAADVPAAHLERQR